MGDWYRDFTNSGLGSAVAEQLGLPRLGSRINSLQQGGLPVDVAETIAWLSQPSAAGVNGQVVRVCGQSFLEA